MYICFFKQKTAYEMRISDWSSDVCSSDLMATMTQDCRGLVLRSCITAAGELRLAVTEEAAGVPSANEVVVRVEAAPINPTDMGLLFGPADLSAARLEGTVRQPVLVAPVPPAAMPFVALRLDQPLPAGVEGAGVVVATGPGQEALLGKTVADRKSVV